MKAPTVKPEKRPGARGRHRRQRGRPVRRLLARLFAVAILVGAIPLGLTLLYRVPFIHPVSTLMLADIVILEGFDRRWRPLEEIGPTLVHSVMMSEDGQFCAHAGIDWGELNAVIDEALSGERTRGASTIPMQTVKNLFLWPGRSFIRKAAEVPLALFFDAVMPKRRTMEIYLNIVEWGPNLYGAEAAALHYFGRSASELTARQAALLAVTLPNPHVRNPANPSAGLSRLASIIEARARRAGAYVGCLE